MLSLVKDGREITFKKYGFVNSSFRTASQLSSKVSISSLPISPEPYGPYMTGGILEQVSLGRCESIDPCALIEDNFRRGGQIFAPRRRAKERGKRTLLELLWGRGRANGCRNRGSRLSLHVHVVRFKGRPTRRVNQQSFVVRWESAGPTESGLIGVRARLWK